MKKKSRAVSLILAAALTASTAFSTGAFAASPSITSDTNKPFTLSTNKSYTFKLTVNGTSSVPKFAVGNGSLLATKLKQKSGNNYYYQITAANASGSTGVYATLTGQKAKLLCIVTVSPVSKAPAPVSKSPVSKAPVSTASTSIKAKYHGATYGAESEEQYKEILSYAQGVTSRKRYQKSYDVDKENQDAFSDSMGVKYSEDANKVVSIIGCFQNAGASGSTGNAYVAYTQNRSNCADDAKAMQAALNVNGFDCKLVWGTWDGDGHMWVSVYFDGAWHQLGIGKFYSGTPSGCTEKGSGYNN